MKGAKYLVLALLGAVSAKAVIPVSIDFSANWISEALNWEEQIRQATSAVEQAREMVAKTNDLIKLAGDPEQAVKNLTDLSKVVTTVGKLTDKANTADKIAGSLNASAALVKSGNKLREDISEEVDVFGKTLKRDLADLQTALKFEAVVEKTRETVESNRKTQKKLSTKLKAAEDLLKNATTQAQLMTAQAEVQRITALMTAADAATRNLVEDAKLTKEEMEVAQEIEAVAQDQATQKRSLALADEMDSQRIVQKVAVQKGMADAQPGAPDTGAMFQRSLVPFQN